MQDLLAELFWDNETLHQAVAQLCQNLPGCLEAQQQYEQTAEKVQALIGFELYDKLYSQLSRCYTYEVKAYYAYGLGLRKDVIQALVL